MTSAPPLDARLAGEVPCSAHPDRPATATCSRCGSFICAEDLRLIRDRAFCTGCAARPEVDYLESLRLRCWGKRDTWTWLVGVGALINAFAAYACLVARLPVQAALFFAITAIGVCFFLGLRWARVAYLFIPVLVLAISATTAYLKGATDYQAGEAVGKTLGELLVPTLIIVAIYRDTRNRLFFKIDVPRAKLEKLWNLYSNNPLARAGFLLAIVGVIVPGAGLVALPLCIVGLTRVSPSSHPPIGRRGQAIAGIVLGALEIIGWGVVIMSSLSID